MCDDDTRADIYQTPPHRVHCVREGRQEVEERSEDNWDLGKEEMMEASEGVGEGATWILPP